MAAGKFFESLPITYQEIRNGPTVKVVCGSGEQLVHQCSREGCQTLLQEGDIENDEKRAKWSLILVIEHCPV